MKRIKVAQIGAGHDHASAVISTLKLRSDAFELVGYAVVEGDEETFEANKNAYEGVKRMTVSEILDFPGLDAVCIETEDRRLTEYGILAAQKGLHIHFDKPGSESDADFDRLMDIVEEKKLVFQTGYMYRYNPAVQKLMEDIRSGRLGEIYSVETQMNCLHSVEKRRWLGNYPGGMLYYLGCHLIDLVYSILGEPDEIIPLSMPIGTDNVDADDFGMAVFKYKNGVSFVKSTAVELGGFERRQLVVCGTKGTVELKPFEWFTKGPENLVTTQITGVREAFDPSWVVAGKFHNTDVFGRYDEMFTKFASYINNEEANPYSYEYERKLHKIILSACGVDIKWKTV